MSKLIKLQEDRVRPQEKLFKSIEAVLAEHGVLKQKDILDPEYRRMIEDKSKFSEPAEPYPEGDLDGVDIGMILHQNGISLTKRRVTSSI
jgi:hypothetical protein